jgi:hypothetical protein
LGLHCILEKEKHGGVSKKRKREPECHKSGTGDKEIGIWEEYMKTEART